MKLGQSLEYKRRGRPIEATDGELLLCEALWVNTFVGLRDGAPETETVLPARSGVFMKVSGQERERVHSTVTGAPPRVSLQPKLATTPAELHAWRSHVKGEEAQFEQAIWSPLQAWLRPFPAERPLWEALKRARTGSQVRRIYSRSKTWLNPRMEFPDGGFLEHSPWRRVLHRDADQFCRAKLDKRYPARDQRASGDYRRIEYFARVMAGLTTGIAPSTAVERLRKMMHQSGCQCWRCILQIAPAFPKSLARYLEEGNWFRAAPPVEEPPLTNPEK